MARHRTRAEADRNRVVCLQCPWFRHDAAADVDRLRELGRLHEHAVNDAARAAYLMAVG